MPVIAKQQLAAEIVKQNASWSAAESWVYNIPESQRKALLGVNINRADLQAIASRASDQPTMAAAAALPTSVDWRSKNGKNYISPVKNQGGCGSCVSFCCCALVEAMAAIEKAIFFLDLSEADLHFCSNHGANCGGWWPTDALDQIKARGVEDEASFPYNSAFHNGNPQCLNVPDRANKISKITSYTVLTTMAARKTWLANNGPVSAVLHVYDDFFGYHNGVYKHVTGAHAGYHCVEVIGYSDIEGCWICKNSWDVSWGDQGFIKIGYGECGIDETSNDKDDTGNLERWPMWGAQGVVLPPPPAPKIGTINADINSDGRLEVLAIALADRSTWTIWQTAPHSGPWSTFSSLGGAVKSIATALNLNGRLELFAIGMDDALWHNWQTAPHAGPWSGWNSLGGKVKAIRPMRNSDGRLEVLAIGMDDALWTIWQVTPGGAWSGWASLGGKIKKLGATINVDGRLEAFGIGMDDALWDVWQTLPHSGPWSGWVALAPGQKVKEILPTCNSDGRLEVLCIGADDALHTIWQTVPHAGPWSGMVSLGGKVKQIDVELNTDGRLEVFGIGMDDGLWNNWQTVAHAGPWSGWNSMGGKVKRISSARNSDGRLEVFGIGMDDGLWSIWQTVPHAGPWSGWTKLA